MAQNCAESERGKCFHSPQVPLNLAEDPRLSKAPEDAFRAAMLNTNEQLHKSAVDDSMSGTTAITCLLRGRKAYVANVGDSRAVLAEQRGSGLVAVPLSRDQTPFRQTLSAHSYLHVDRLCSMQTSAPPQNDAATLLGGCCGCSGDVVFGPVLEADT